MTFGYFIIQKKGFFTVVADFNSQQLTFATAVWNMLHSGNAGEWIWNIDLGSSFVNTFSFYNLGSPFYWISLLFPRGSFPYLAGFLYILKYVVAGMTAYLYLRLFAEDRRYAVIGALLYAFSGFQTTNLEFFHFHDVTAVFPLMLLGLELSMKDKRRRPAFVFAIFLNCLINYFFFIQEVIFLVVYYLVRYHGLGWKEFLKERLDSLYISSGENDYIYQKSEFDFYCPDWQIQEEQLLVYWIYTYFCGAVYDDEIFTKVKMAVVCTLFIHELDVGTYLKNEHHFNLNDQIQICYQFSRELEHSDLNLNKFQELMSENNIFSFENLLKIC